MNEQPSAAKDKLLADMKVVVSDAEELLRATANQAGNKMDELRKRMQDNLSTAREHISETELALVERAKAIAHSADEYVHQHPWQSVGIAAGVAFLIGLLVGRR